MSSSSAHDNVPHRITQCLYFGQWLLVNKICNIWRASYINNMLYVIICNEKKCINIDPVKEFILPRRQSCRRLCNIKPLVLLVSGDREMALMTITSASAGLSTEYLVASSALISRLLQFSYQLSWWLGAEWSCSCGDTSHVIIGTTAPQHQHWDQHNTIHRHK